MAKNTQAEIKLLQIVVGSKESLSFYKKMFAFLGYKITDKKDHMFVAKGDSNSFVVYHGTNISGSGIWIFDAGILAIFFRVKNKKAVDDFRKKVLDPYHIKPRFNDKGREEERKYGIFFDTQEKLKIGVITD